MLERCARHQHEPGSEHATYVTPPAMWREQETLPDPEAAYPMSCEDTA